MKFTNIFAGTLAALVFFIVPAAAWFTHIYHCFVEEAWGFLIAGAILFPIAVCHGIYLWF